MKQNQNGFSVVEITLVIAIFALLGVGGWYVIDQKSNENTQKTTTSTNNQSEQLEAYEASTTVPGNWKVYKNDKYKFAISHPADWELGESDENMIAESSAATDKSMFYLGFRPFLNGSKEIQYSIHVTHETLEQAIDSYKTNIQRTQTEDESIKLSTTSEKNFMYDGHEAMQFETTSDDGTKPNSYSTLILISANNLLYKFDTGFHDENVLQDGDLLTVFESLKIE